MNILVIGVATGSRDIETWAFEDDDTCDKFCKLLAASSGRRVLVVKGEVLRHYEMSMPVERIEGDIPGAMNRANMTDMSAGNQF